MDVVILLIVAAVIVLATEKIGDVLDRRTHRPPDPPLGKVRVGIDELERDRRRMQAVADVGFDGSPR